MCILLYVKFTSCCGIPQFYGQSEEVHLAFIYVHSSTCKTYLVQWYSIDLWSIGGGYICPGYMCILLYMKIIWCSGITQIFGQLQQGALVYLHSAISETYLVQWYSIYLWSIGGGIHLPWVYVHSSICENYLVYWYYIDLWSIGGGEPWYMCILLYVKLTSCCAIPQIYGQLGGTFALGICRFFYM